MKNITADTPRTEATIQGEVFRIPTPFAEGYVLSANEAAALNQVLVENVRNNIASKVKTAKEAGAFNAAAMQASLDEYVQGYEFGVSRGGGSIADPVERKAMEMATNIVKNAIKQKGHKLSDVAADDLRRLAKETLEANPQIRDKARQAVELERSVGDVALGELTTSQPAAEQPTKKRKAA